MIKAIIDGEESLIASIGDSLPAESGFDLHTGAPGTLVMNRFFHPQSDHITG